MDAIEAASLFLGKSPSGAQDSTSPSETHTITGTATSDSADGLVMVDLEGYTVSADDSQSLELPTTVDVKEGDTVQVTLVGGVGKSPIVTGVVGGGDRLSGNVQDAVDAADAATTAVANVTNYFFHDDDGVHVTTTEGNPDTGSNVLIDSDGMDVRDGTDVLAYFHSTEMGVGESSAIHIVINSNGMWVMDGSDMRAFFGSNVCIGNSLASRMVIDDTTLNIYVGYIDFYGQYHTIHPLQITYNGSYSRLIAPDTPMWVQSKTGELTLAADDDGSYPVRIRGAQFKVADNTGTTLWTGTTQELADALTKPRFYQGSKVVNVGSTNITSCTLWLQSDFETEFNVVSGNASKCMLWVCNGNVQAGQTGPVQAEWWSASQIGWHARWSTNATGNKQFNYMVAVPPEYSTV